MIVKRRIPSRQRDLLIGILAALSVIGYVTLSAVVQHVGFPLDDSWIHQTYARNLARHGEWAFIPGQTSVGATSPLFAVLLAAGYLLHIPFFAWTFALGALALAAAGWIGARLSEKMFPGLPSVGLWTGLALVLTWHLVWAAASGMETMLFCTLSLAVVGLAWRELPEGTGIKKDHFQQEGNDSRAFRRGMVLGLVGAALTLTRPEGAGLVGLAGLWVLLARPYGWRTYAAWGSGVAIGWVIGVAPYAAFNAHVSGTFLPNTASAKQAENAPALELPLWKRYGRLLLPLVAGGQLLLIPGLFMAFYALFGHDGKKRQNLLFLLPLAWAVMDLSAYALRLPAPYQHGRYVIPILPHLLLYGVGGTLELVRAGRKTPLMRVLSRSLALSAALSMLGFCWIGAQTYARDVRIINTEMVDTAHWVKENLPVTDLLAVHDIGALGYYAPRPILDLAGLVSPEVVPIIRDHEAIMQLMCERQVRYLMVLPDQLPAAGTDPRLSLLFSTGSPYAQAAGGGNMAVYQLHWPETCD